MVFGRAPDIKTALGLHLFQPFKEGDEIRLVVSDSPTPQNSLWNMLISRTFRSSKMWLPIAIGYDMMCRMVFGDLGQMPHAMYAGATRSGKSVGLICLILSLAMQAVCKVNLILFDVGANTMAPFEGLSHLAHPIVKDTEEGIYVIAALVAEMERRIKLSFDELRRLPAIACVIDEYVSFIANIGNKKLSHKVANDISNLLRRGRHAKIHVVLATQDPTIKNMRVDVGNITARMAFRCAKYHNSITILGEGGAENLPGKGAMLYKSNEYPDPVYLQGAYMSPEDVKRLLDRIKSANHDSSNKFVIPELDAPQTTDEADFTLCAAAEMVMVQTAEAAADKELADIILWVLGQDTVSYESVKKQFRWAIV